MTSVLRVDNVQNAAGVGSFSIESDGTVNASKPIKQGGSSVIQWVEVSPEPTEWSFSGTVTGSAKTINPASIPSTARYLLADVFVTADSNDHQNFVLGRTAGDTSALQNWVDTRGTQPSTRFGSGVGNRHAVTLTYNGEVDGYTPNYGLWYSSQAIPCTGRTIYFGNHGNSGSSGWVYMRVRGYSL